MYALQNTFHYVKFKGTIGKHLLSSKFNTLFLLSSQFTLHFIPIAVTTAEPLRFVERNCSS